MLNKNQKVNNDIKEKFCTLQEDSFFRGHLDFHSPIQIEGKFEGSIEGDSTLEIGKAGRVEAFIQSRSVIVFGEVIGNIYADKKVVLYSGASVTGNIRTPNLEIEEGVIFEGQCETKPKQESST